MFSSIHNKRHHFSSLIIVLFIILFMISSCEHEVPVENQSDTTPTASVRNLNATAGDKTVYLSWTNPPDSDFYGTRITFSPSVSGVSQPVVIEGEYSENSSTVFNGLRNGIEYTFTFVALDKNQNKSKSVSIKATPKEPADTTPPKEVTELKAELGDKSVTLTWKNPEDRDFMSTQITFTPEVDGITQPVIIEGNSSETSSTTINKLEYDVEYTFTLKTLDKKQNQSNGIQIKTTPTDKIPPEKIETITTVAGDKSVTLSWTNPGDTDFEGIQITFTPEVSYIPQPLVIRGEPNKTSDTTISGLQNDTTYTFKITAFDKVGNKSEPVSVKASPCDKTPPAEITNISATAEDKSVTILWTNPSDTDFAKTQITFTPEVEDVSQPIFVTGLSNNPMEYTINNLQNETEYTFTLKTIDNNDNFSEGKIIKVTPEDKTPPEEISDFTLVPNHNRITLNWLNPSDIDFYGVEISSNPAAGTLSQPIFLQCNPSEPKELTILNLENDVEYEFTIKTIDTYNNKSEGIQKKAVPKASTLSMTVTLPNDNGRITLTNDKAPIKVSVTSSHEITKAVWEKIETNDSTDLETLINNPQATSFNIDNTNDETIINVTENGFYAIAVKNSEGIITSKQVEIKTIDKNPLSAITNLTVDCDGDNINIAWTNPVPQNIYDAPIQDIIISYTYNDNNSDIANSSITYQDSSIQNYSFKLPKNKTVDDYIQIFIKTTDTVGNESVTTYSEKTNCGLIIVTDIENAPDKIRNIKHSGKIIVNGSFDNNSYASELAKIKNSISSLNYSLRIDLDLSETKNLRFVPNKAFLECTQLSSIKLPSGIRQISSSAFKDCKNLLNIEFPDSIEEYSSNMPFIGEDAFCGCKNLKSIIIPEGTTEISPEAFCGCTNLESIIIPEGVKYIRDFAFQSCRSLTSIIIPETVIRIDRKAFQDCTCLSTIEFPNKITEDEYMHYLGQSAFEECESLTSIIIPDGVKYIAGYAFSDCTNLSSIDIPDTVKYIDDGAFSGTRISHIEIPENVTYIGKYAFASCSYLSSIKIPNCITDIKESSFQGCTSLSKIEIPSSVNKIGNSAFKNCSNLTSVSISEGVIGIEATAFAGCTSLAKVIIPKSLTTIDDTAFYKYYNSDTYANQYANLNDFEENSTITAIYYQGTLEEWCTKKWNPEKISISYDLYINDKKIEDASIKEGITNISTYAFSGCTSLKTITIPEGVINLGAYSFSKLTLNNIVIPRSLTYLESTYFWDSEIKSLEFVDTESEWSYSCEKLKREYHYGGQEVEVIQITDNGTIGAMNSKEKTTKLLYYLMCKNSDFIPPMKLFNQNYIEE